MSTPGFDGAGDGWITSPADPRLVVLWPGAEDYGDDLAFPLWCAMVQCSEFAPEVTASGYARQVVTAFSPGFIGTLVASYGDGTVTWTVEVLNDTEEDLSAFRPVVAPGLIEAPYRPTAAVFLEVPGGTGSTFRMSPNGALDLSWAGSWPDGTTLDFAITGPAGAVPPGPAVLGEIPDHWVAAQVLQCRALVRAGIVGDQDRTGADGEGVVVFPMDWTVKSLLRPRKGKPYFGHNRRQEVMVDG